MVRHMVVAKSSIDNVQQIQSSILRVSVPFHPKTNVEKSLLGEIEACRALIWQCVGGQGNCVDDSSQKIDKAMGIVHSAVSNKDTISSISDTNEQPNRVDIEFRVNAMKVVDLRKELKRRDLETTGLKKQLQARLREAMINESSVQPTERAQSESPAIKAEHLPIEAEKLETSIVDEVHIPKSDESNQAANGKQKSAEICQQVNIHLKSEKTNPSEPDLKALGKVSLDISQKIATNSSIGSDEVQPMEVNEGTEEKSEEEESEKLKMVPKKQLEEGALNIKQYWKKLSKPGNVLVNAPVVVQNEARVKKSPLRMVVKTVQKIQPSENDCSIQGLAIAESKSDLTDDDFDGPMSEFAGSEVSAPVQMSKAGSVRDLVSKIQNGTCSTAATAGVGGNGSALSKNLQAKKEARLAKMAEIRGKSKPVATSKHVLAPKEYASTLSSLSAVSAPGGTKKNKLAAQIREKAATAAMRKENVSSCVNQSTATAAEPGKRDLQYSVADVDAKKHLVDSAAVFQGFSKKQKVASPMNTYEISDREESDSDSSDSESENEKRKKKIPLWAQKANLLPALEQQYNGCIDGRRVDPDEIFPEVQTCDLEAIFGGKKSRYTRRTSSGNWTNDKVTTAEKLVYKRTMGFASHA